MDKRGTATNKENIGPAYPKFQRPARILLSLVIVGVVWGGISLNQRRQAKLADAQFQATQHAQSTQTQTILNLQTARQATQTQQAKATINARATQQAIQTQQVQATQYAQATAQAKQVSESKLRVVVATFDGPEDVYGMHNQIIEELNADFSIDNQVVIIPLTEVITPDDGSSIARALGKQYLADVVIWGWYRPTDNPNITIHIENLEPEKLLSLKKSTTLQPVVSLKELNSFSFQHQAGKEASSLISFIAGYVQYKSGNYDDAITRFNRALEYVPGKVRMVANLPNIYFYRGNAEFDKGQLKEAILDYGKAVETDPEDVNAYNNRGIAYNNLGQFWMAIANFNIAIKIGSNNAEAYNNRGVAYTNLKEFNRAVQDFSQALEIDPQYTIAYFNRATVYAANLKQPESAIQDFNKVIEIDPQFSNAYNSRGVVYIELDKIAQALADFKKYEELTSQKAP